MGHHATFQSDPCRITDQPFGHGCATQRFRQIAAAVEPAPGIPIADQLDGCKQTPAANVSHQGMAAERLREQSLQDLAEALGTFEQTLLLDDLLHGNTRSAGHRMTHVGVPMGETGSVSVTSRAFQSSNVLALLPGSSRPDEFLMVSGHWDAYGVGEPDAEGRTVRPGAHDDALGIAGVLEIARVLRAGPPLARSVVFAAWTAEESGLLGSDYYADNPLYPLEKTVANLTLDILQTAGPARDVILVGEGQSELEDELARFAATQGRGVTPENLPENGLFFRADHFPLARRGVPVLLIMAIAGGADLVDGGREAGDQWIADYIAACYHQTCDAWDPDWDLRGAAQDIDLFRLIIEDLGNSTRWPQWKSGSEFKAVREQSASARRAAE